MKYHNPLMVEMMVPRGEETASRIHGFYGDIGWVHRNDSESEFETVVHPSTSEGIAPTVAYRQTENPDKIRRFEDYDNETPSRYSRGLRLPGMQDLVEVCLVVPTDDDVHAIFENGGDLLEAHTHIAPREHEGRQEFRYSDPFNYSFRVTADVGWEVQRDPQPLVLGEDILTTTQAARKIGVSRPTLVRMIDKGEVEGAFKVGRDRRIPLGSIIEVLKKRTLEG